MGKRLKVPISAARKQLFQLTDLVRKSGDDTVVVLEQRGGVEPVALVREARLAYLEAQVERLDKREEKPFTLVGSLTTDLDEDELTDVLRQIRSEWTPRAPKALPTRSTRKAAGRRR
jgi:hypothetical protein